MDEEVGAVCQVCGKRDFLPFRCKGCKRMLCLEHRSPTLHDCAGLNITDATSMNCVICGKSIVYDKSRDVNEVWEKHFATECTKVAAKEKEKKVCPVSACRNILGPSNTFRCPKCQKVVCLSHRNPDDHDCTQNDRAKRKIFLDQVSKKKETVKKKSSPKVIDPANTLIGSAARRGRKEEDGLICPFCMKKGWNNVEELQAHVNSAHNEGPPTASSPTTAVQSFPSRPSPATASSSTRTAGGIGLERCPLCSATFRDPVELVNHFDSVHNEQSGSGGGGGSGGSGRNSSSNTNCTTT